MPRHTDPRSRQAKVSKPQLFTRWVPRPLEQLEDRLTPSVTLTNNPAWLDAGPNTVTGGEVSGIATSPVIGAVSALAAHPTNANIMYAGGANGGVWKTVNATAASPTWTPLTDSFPSLSISTLALNPDNPNQIIAGIAGTADGSYAINTIVSTATIINLDSRGQARGDLIGALYSNDGGNTWAVLNNNIAGKKVVGVAVRNGYMLVATDAGVYRSSDGGATFNLAANGLPAGGVFDLAADPGAAVNQIASATWDAGVATIKTAAPHGLSVGVGLQVVVTGLSPSGYNGTFVYTVVDANTFTYSLATNPGNLGAGGTQGAPANAIASATWSGGAATITASGPTGLAIGETVTVAGVNRPGYNGSFVVTGVNPATDTFTFALAANPGAGAGGLASIATNAIAGATWLGGIATITTAAANTVAVGENIVVSGVALPGYNGTFVVSAIDAANNRISYSLPINPGNSLSGGTETNDVDAIASATWQNGLATITTSAAHGILAGQTVTIAGVNLLGFNGTFVVTSVISPTQFTYALAASPGGIGSGGTATTAPNAIASASWLAGTATITTVAANGLSLGETVKIAGIQPAGYNGTFVVTGVLSATQFTYVLVLDPGTMTTGGTESANSNTDPIARNRFYVALQNANGVGGQGVYRTDDGGVTWGVVTNAQMQIGATTTNVQIAVYNSGILTNNIVYVAVENNNTTGRQVQVGQSATGGPGATAWDYAFANRLSSISTISWSPNQGGTWTRMDAPRSLTPTSNITVRSDSSGNVFVSTASRHHLRDGDIVRITNVRDNTPAVIGRNAANQLQVNGLWYVIVINESTFELRENVDEGGYLANYTGDYEHIFLDTNLPFVNPQGKWQQLLGANAGERSEFFDLVADPTNSNLIYLGTDRANPTFFGSAANGPVTYTGSFWRGDRSLNPTEAPFLGTYTPTTTNQWTSITNAGAGGTAPAADSRDLVFSNGQLYAGTGGGIYRLSTPSGSGTWTSANGNLGVSDVFSVAYDTLNNRYFAATTDTQAINQTNSGGFAFTSEFSSADMASQFRDQANSFRVLADNSRLTNAGAASNQTVRYYVGTNFSTIYRQTYSAANTVVGAQSGYLNFASPLSTTIPNSGLIKDTQAINANENVHIAMALNQNDQRRAIFGYNGVYEDADPSGLTLTGDIVNDVTPNGMTGHVEQFVYGGKLGGVNYNQVVYFTTSTGQLWVRGQFGPNFSNLTAAITAASGQPGQPIYAVVGDPDDYRHIFVAQGTKILESKDFGLTFVDISDNLIGPVTADGTAGPGKLTSQVRSLAVYDSSAGSAVAGDLTLIAGGRGGVYRLQTGAENNGGSWSPYGSALPHTVVNDLQVVNNQRLIAGTGGRGIWNIPDVSTTINQDSTLTVNGTAGNDIITISLDPNNPNIILVWDGTAETSYTRGQFTALTVNGLGGADTVIIDSTVNRTTHTAIAGGNTDFVNFKITVDGGGDAGDTLYVVDEGATAARQVTITNASIGAGVGDTIFNGNGRVLYTGFDSGTIDVSTGAGADTYVLTSLIPGTTTLHGGAGSETYTYAMDPAATSILNIVEAPAALGTDTLNITGTAAADSFNITPTGVTLGINTLTYAGIENIAVSGLGGNDTFNLVTQGATATTSVAILGGAGADQLTVNGTGASENVGIDITAATGAGSFTGTAQPISFTGTEVLAFDGGGGSNSLTWRDRTNGTYGTALNPENGVIFTPSSTASATTGNIRVGDGSAFPTVFFANVNNALVLNGDPDGSGDRDTFTYLGFSTATLASGGPFNEPTSADGSDTINVTDQSITLSNAALGAVRGVSFGTNASGAPNFSTINVRGGNEASTGDRFTATPSLRTNIVINGMNPTSGSAADQLNVLANGATDRYRTSDPRFGAPQTRIYQTSNGADLGFYNIENVTAPTSGGGGGGGGGALSINGYYTVASGVGSIAEVQVYDRLTAQLILDISPFDVYMGGVRAAVGDVNGDGIQDIVVSAGAGVAPHIKIYNGRNGALIASFLAYAPVGGQYFTGGVDVAVGDLDGDGFAEIITGSGPGAGPHIKVFDGLTFAEKASYYAFDPTFLGGIHVAVGDTNGDGALDLIVAAQGGGGAQPRVTVFDGKDNRVLQNFFAYDITYNGGVFVASGDVNGDGFADIITGTGTGSQADVRVFDGRTGGLIAQFLANDGNPDAVPTVPFEGGVSVAAVDIDNDGIDEILTGKGPGTYPILRFFRGNGTFVGSVNAFRSGYAQGAYVGG